MSTTIYILRLEGGRYYVGKTDNVMIRYQQHLNGGGSAWTRMYKPITVLKTIENASPYDEDRYVKEYMDIYGIQNVRGGSYVSLELSDSQKNAIQSEIRGATDVCSNCGKKGHFVKDCYIKKNIAKTPSKPDGGCYRCGRSGHYSSNCYASTTTSGYLLDDSDSEDEYDDSD